MIRHGCLNSRAGSACIALVMLTAIGAAPPKDPDNPTVKSETGRAKPRNGADSSQASGKKKNTPNSPKKKKARSRTPTDGESSEQPPPRNPAVKGLRLIIAEAEFEDLTLEDFTEWIGRTTGAQIVVRWNMLEAAGYERDETLNIKAAKIPMRKLIEEAFNQLNPILERPELSVSADGNILTISTRKDLNSRMITRVYEAEDLLISVPNFIAEVNGPQLRPRHNVEAAGRKRIGTQDPEISALIKTLTTHIEPHSWKTAGGKGTIRFFNGRLIIYNSIEVHLRISGAILRRDE